MGSSNTHPILTRANMVDTGGSTWWTMFFQCKKYNKIPLPYFHHSGLVSWLREHASTMSVGFVPVETFCCFVGGVTLHCLQPTYRSLSRSWSPYLSYLVYSLLDLSMVSQISYLNFSFKLPLPHFLKSPFYLLRCPPHSTRRGLYQW